MAKLQAGVGSSVTATVSATVVGCPGGTFTMGSDDHYPEEAPAHRVRVDAFSIDADRGDQRRSSPRSSTRPATSPWPSGRSTRPTTRARRPENLRAGLDGVHARPRARSTCATSASGGRGRRARRWRHPEGPGSSIDERARPPGGARRPRGRRGVRRLGRRRAAHRGRVGVRRPRRPRGRRVHLGRRGAARRADHGEHLGRPRLPLAQHRRERLAAHRAGRQLPGQRLRAVRHGRQRLGVDRRLVDRAATPTDADKPCCVPENPRGGDARGELRPGPAAVPDRPQGDQGRLAPVRRHLLPALPAGRPAAADDRHRHEPHRLPVRTTDPTPRRRPP